MILAIGAKGASERTRRTAGILFAPSAWAPQGFAAGCAESTTGHAAGARRQAPPKQTPGALDTGVEPGDVAQSRLTLGEPAGATGDGYPPPLLP